MRRTTWTDWKQMNQINIGSFWKLFLKPDEEKDLREFLKENDYLESEEGLKEFLIDCMTPEEKPKKFSVNEFLEQNPEVKVLGQIGGRVVSEAIRKKLFGK